MKNLALITSILLCMNFISCSEDLDEKNTPIAGTEKDVSVSVNLETKALPVNTGCNLYIFSKDSDDTDFLFNEIISLSSNNISIKLKNGDISNKSFRFLFLASDSDSPEIYVTTTSGAPENNSTKWDDIILRADMQKLSADNYYKIIDKTGSQILDEGTINAILTRLTGQIVLDISRINEILEQTVDIQSGDIKSVLDRVYKIEVQYTGLTRDIIFDNNDLSAKPDDVWTSVFTDTIIPQMDDSLRVVIPQTETGLEESGWNTRGSVRIKGIYCLPADENITLKFIFHYYDTTPACGAPAHNHETSCYNTKNIVLNMPKENSDYKPLSVISNYFTLNKAGIRYDRIIDLNVDSSFGFLADWDN